MNGEILQGNTGILDEHGDVKPLEDVFPDGIADIAKPMVAIEDEPDFAKESARIARTIGASVVTSLDSRRQQEHEPKKITYPRSIQQAVAAVRLKQQEEERHEDAYSGLGGGLPSREHEPVVYPLEGSLAAYKDWHSDTRVAVEQYGVLELLHGGFEAMRKDDKEKFSLQFNDFLWNMTGHRNALKKAAESEYIPSELKELYGSRSLEELRSYGVVLEVLRDELEATGLPQKVRKTLNIPEDLLPGSRMEQSIRRKNHQSARLDHNKRGALQVRFEDGAPRIQRAKDDVSAVG